MTRPFDLTDYQPGDDGKFSPNLHRWLARLVGGRTYKVLASGGYLACPQVLMPSYEPMTGRTLQFDETMSGMPCLIGYFDPNDRSIFIGARVANLLTEPFPRGGHAHMGAHMAPYARKGTDVTDWFWRSYAARGRCLFDPGHGMPFIGDDGRFRHLNGQHRVCNWCGAEQLAAHVERTVSHRHWRDVA